MEKAEGKALDFSVTIQELCGHYFHFRTSGVKDHTLYTSKLGLEEGL